jgi:tRNA(Arg) A34 adenosine deaminase TadA
MQARLEARPRARRLLDVSETDETHLRRAIALAQLARDLGEQPFGSLLVGPDGAVLREDHNTVLSDRDVTAHPELKLARWAARELDAEVARGTTLYTSCQPCAMCSNVIARAGLGRVVFALSSEQLSALKPAGAVAPDATEAIYDGPALDDEARTPVAGYYD